MASRTRNPLSGPIHRPVNRIELAGAILMAVVLQTLILLMIYPTNRNAMWDQRLSAVEAWAKSAAVRNELVLETDKRVMKIEKRLKQLEDPDASGERK